jgi:hypothetical protein
MFKEKSFDSENKYLNIENKFKKNLILRDYIIMKCKMSPPSVLFDHQINDPKGSETYNAILIRYWTTFYSIKF